jgi:hypothetical protein
VNVRWEQAGCEVAQIRDHDPLSPPTYQKTSVYEQLATGRATRSCARGPSWMDFLTVREQNYHHLQQSRSLRGRGKERRKLRPSSNQLTWANNDGRCVGVDGGGKFVMEGVRAKQMAKAKTTINGLRTER